MTLDHKTSHKGIFQFSDWDLYIIWKQISFPLMYGLLG